MGLNPPRPALKQMRGLGVKHNPMTALELYKYISDNQLQWRWENFEDGEDVIIFLYHFELADFASLIKNFLDYDEPFNVVVTSSSVAIRMQEICDFYGIEIESVFPKN